VRCRCRRRPREALFDSAGWHRLRVSDHALGVEFDLGLQGLLNDTAFRAITCIGPARRRGNTAMFILTDVLVLERLMPPRGPRSVFCVAWSQHARAGGARVNASGDQPGHSAPYHQKSRDFISD